MAETEVPRWLAAWERVFAMLEEAGIHSPEQLEKRIAQLRKPQPSPTPTQKILIVDDGDPKITADLIHSVMSARVEDIGMNFYTPDPGDSHPPAEPEKCEHRCPKCGSDKREVCKCLVPDHPHVYVDHDYCCDPWHESHPSQPAPLNGQSWNDDVSLREQPAPAVGAREWLKSILESDDGKSSFSREVDGLDYQLGKDGKLWTLEGLCTAYAAHVTAADKGSTVLELAKKWAANDSLWTTQGMVEASLVMFAHHVTAAKEAEIAELKRQLDRK